MGKITSNGLVAFPRTVSASEVLYLSSGDTSTVSTIGCQLVFSGGANVSLVVKGRAHGFGLTSSDNETIAYKTAAAPGTFATAAVTADAILLIPAEGLDVFLDITVTSGTVTVYPWTVGG